MRFWCTLSTDEAQKGHDVGVRSAVKWLGSPEARPGVEQSGKKGLCCRASGGERRWRRNAIVGGRTRACVRKQESYVLVACEQIRQHPSGFSALAKVWRNSRRDFVPAILRLDKTVLSPRRTGIRSRYSSKMLAALLCSEKANILHD